MSPAVTLRHADHADEGDSGFAAATFVAFGNPLLDIVTTVTPAEEDRLVRTYGLQKDVGQEIDTTGLMKEIKGKK